MICFCILYQYTKYYSRDDGSGHGSVPNGKGIEQAVYRVIAPKKELAIANLTHNYSGYSRDPAFSILDVSELEINAIVEIRTR